MDYKPQSTKSMEDKLSFFLRLSGALIIISAAVGFSIKNWGQLESWEKCSLFLLSNVIIALVALVSKVWFKDQKGAGALFAVAASMVPVHIAQLGGFIMNAFGFEKVTNTNFLPMFDWKAESNYTPIILLIVGFITFIPIVHAAFQTLLKKENSLLATKLFLATNAILLLPFRSAWFVLPVATAMIIAMLFNDKKYFKGKREIGTIIVRILMFVAPIIMLSRMYYIYNHTAITIGISLLLFSITFFVAANYLHENSEIVLAIQGTSIINSLIGWLIIAIDIINTMQRNYVQNGHELLIIGIPMSVLLILGGRFARRRLDSCYNAAILIALIVQAFELILYSSCFSATFVTILSILIFSYCIINHDNTFAVLTFLLLIVGIFKNYSIAMKEDRIFPWFVIGFAGVVIILTASIPEKFARFLKREDIEYDDELANTSDLKDDDNQEATTSSSNDIKSQSDIEISIKNNTPTETKIITKKIY